MLRNVFKYVHDYGRFPIFLDRCKWSDTQLRLSIIYVKEWIETYNIFVAKNRAKVLFNSIINGEYGDYNSYRGLLDKAYFIYNIIERQGVRGIFLRLLKDT